MVSGVYAAMAIDATRRTLPALADDDPIGGDFRGGSAAAGDRHGELDELHRGDCGRRGGPRLTTTRSCLTSPQDGWARPLRVYFHNQFLKHCHR